MSKDPVCGMEVDESRALKGEKDGKTYFFCSKNCQDKFLGKKEEKVKVQIKPLLQNKAIIKVAGMHRIRPYENQSG